MFVDYQNFAGSMELNFMGYWFVVLQYRTIHFFIKRSLGRKFVGDRNPRNPGTLNPHEQ